MIGESLTLPKTNLSSFQISGFRSSTLRRSRPCGPRPLPRPCSPRSCPWTLCPSSCSRIRPSSRPCIRPSPCLRSSSSPCLCSQTRLWRAPCKKFSFNLAYLFTKIYYKIYHYHLLALWLVPIGIPRYRFNIHTFFPILPLFKNIIPNHLLVLG